MLKGNLAVKAAEVNDSGQSANGSFHFTRIQCNLSNMNYSFVGQCAETKQRILLTNVPKDYVKVSSGLGKPNPVNLMSVDTPPRKKSTEFMIRNLHYLETLPRSSCSLYAGWSAASKQFPATVYPVSAVMPTVYPRPCLSYQPFVRMQDTTIHLINL